MLVFLSTDKIECLSFFALLFNMNENAFRENKNEQGDDEQTDLSYNEQITSKPRLQVGNSFTTWLQIPHRSLLFGGSIRKTFASSDSSLRNLCIELFRISIMDLFLSMFLTL